MNLLALDTSTLRAAVALERSDGTRFETSVDPTLRHGRELLPAIRASLRSAGLAATDLGAIAVGLGPGSYTGLRVGVTAAKTLAYASGARLVGLDSLEFFARSAPVDSLRVVVISDAQRGDFHAAEFSRSAASAPLLRLGPIRIVAADELIGSLDGPASIVGPGLTRWDRPWPSGTVPIRIDDPPPGLLLDMAREAIDAGKRDDPWFLEPIYLRRSAAEDLWEKRR